ncbi:sporulation-specific protein 1 [[Candida] jaroonii]|uniref:Sporulation-specific protein 1 n=1 Tax=[Candida] jaroonii TaxID=467808 RepID=A0ACA9YBK8_9ASCO|nr:sporulation-specific protein 1 [[Candida] jaroonii]
MTSRIYSADELEVCEEVGRGGFGVVYRGLIKTTNEEVAIKQIDLENDQTDLFEINKEISIISECRLPQITKYLGCFVKNYKLWVIMEFVNGGSLFEILQPGPVTDEKTISIIAKEILLALDYLHNQGKIHRDLKSQNILLGSKGEIKLTDFGVSTQLSSNFSRRNTTVGTPYWMAPEVILNDNGGHNSKADIWSLGCCLYELFNGKPPLQNQYPPMKALRYISKCTKDDDFVTIIKLNELEISSNFKDFLIECFRVDTRKRLSANKLLKHKFITKNSVDSNEQSKLIKTLITNKHLWDQENHVLKSQKFYLPTEMVQNQQKWNLDEKEEENTIKFDISTMNEYPSPKSTTRESSISPETTLTEKTPKKKTKKINYQTLQQHDSKQKNLSKTLKPELSKIVNKVFHKLDTKSSLSTEQYDLLVSLNQNFLDLLTFSNTTGNDNSTSKLIICQYLKYFMKELNKNDNDSRLLLKKLILPSEMKNTDTIKIKSKEMGPFDEIENSLFETWIDEMKHLKG